MPPACFLNAPTLPLMPTSNNVIRSTVEDVSGSGAERKSMRHIKRNQVCSANAWYKVMALQNEQRGRILKPQV